MTARVSTFSSTSTSVPLQHATRAQLLLGFAIIYVVWGSTYLGIRFGLETIPPFFMGGARFLIAGSVMYSFARLRGAAKPTAVEWRSSAIIGFMLLFVGNGCVSWSEQHVSSGMTSLLVATVPLWLVICEWLQGQHPHVTKLLGVAIGLVGVGLLVLPGSKGGTVIDPIGAAVLTLSSLSWTIGSLYARTARLAKPPTLAIGMQMLVGGAMLMVLAAFTGEVTEVAGTGISLRSGLALLYLIVFGSLIGFSTYMWLLRVASPTAVGTYAYVNPVVAVLLGVLFAGERLHAQAVLAMLVIVGGVVLASVGPGLVRSLRGAVQ